MVFIAKKMWSVHGMHSAVYSLEFEGIGNETIVFASASCKYVNIDIHSGRWVSSLNRWCGYMAKSRHHLFPPTQELKRVY